MTFEEYAQKNLGEAGYSFQAMKLVRMGWNARGEYGEQAARAQGVSVPMKRIAEKKLEQMGATVHGVLVKNEAGAWAAVSEAGRVMWLDGFEGQAAKAGSDNAS